MIGLDARKAFDSVDHDYLQEVLEAYVLGPKFKSWFKLLNKNVTVGNSEWCCVF